ncbi:MAG: hypothetical protein PSN46_07555 [Gammaproteobacteria bacterium]|nr:hypothetical protein [Gammaproteobacteria bacterium]
MPAFINPDQLWTTTVNSPTYQNIERANGILSDDRFAKKLGDVCINQKTGSCGRFFYG